MRDDRLGSGEQLRRRGQRVERARPAHDELEELRDPPGVHEREDDGAGGRDPAPGQPAGAEEQECEDPPVEPVPVQVRERHRDDRGDDVALGRDREIELGVEVAERAQEFGQRERTCRQTKRATPSTIMAATR